MKRPYKAAVARGIKWLDANRPGWRKKINPNDLCMSDCFQCVIGQVFGDFAHIQKVPRCGPLWASSRGFNIPDGIRSKHDNSLIDKEYALLRDEWLLHLTEEVAREKEAVDKPC